MAVDCHVQLETIGGKRLVLESTRDVTQTKALMARQRLLLDELSHRVRNTLTIVQSIAHQTVRNTSSADEFVKAFDGRLLALAAAHKLLVESQWEGAQIGRLTEGQLSHFRDHDRGRITLSGGPVRLPPAVAMPFGLVLHELASNATKYGALSNETGRVALSWHLDDATRNGPRRLTVIWQESGGPPVPHDLRSGFGSTLIERGIPGAKVRHEFRPEGVVCTIELDIAGTKADELGEQKFQRA